jgi:hypothetical protein
MLFAEFKRRGVFMEQRILKQIKDSYFTMRQDRFADASKVRNDFGTLPNQAAADLEEEQKLRKYPWSFENFKHLMMLMCFRVMKFYFLRASKGVSRYKRSFYFISTGV